MNIRQNPGINLGILGLGQPNPEISGSEKKRAEIAFLRLRYEQTAIFFTNLCHLIVHRPGYLVRKDREYNRNGYLISL